MSFTCTFCDRALDDDERDEDLRGEPCCLVCGPVEDDSRRRSPYAPPPTAGDARVAFWDDMLPRKINISPAGTCLKCGQPRVTCCC